MKRKRFVVIAVMICVLISLLIALLHSRKCHSHNRDRSIVIHKDRSIVTNSHPNAFVSNFYFGKVSKDALYVEPQQLKNLLTIDECQRLMEWASSRFQMSTVRGDKKTTKARKSETAWIPLNTFLFTQRLGEVALKSSGATTNAGSLQIVRYQPHGYFRKHYDQCPECDDYCVNNTIKNGPRYANIIIYLNSGFGGGFTNFPNLGKKYRPNAGDGLIFYMLDYKGQQVHPYAEHSGTPVTSGIKWIANLWMRKDTTTVHSSESCDIEKFIKKDEEPTLN